jgi:hypothetical protein
LSTDAGEPAQITSTTPQTPHRRPPARPRSLLPLLSPLAFLTLACLHHTTTQMTGICSGENVGRRLTLTIDSVTPAAPDALRRLRDHHFEITLTLANPFSAAPCHDRTGEATISRDELPDALASAVAAKASGAWRVDGLAVAVDLNPGVLDNHLELSLPLDGSAGTWRLSSLVGAVASGRLLPAPPRRRAR